MVICTKCLRAVKLKGGGTIIDDFIQIQVNGGLGGGGLRYVGGIGGKGGDVYLKAFEGQTIAKMKFYNATGIYQAKNGKAASKLHVLGEAGKDLHVRVPLGITVSTEQGQRLGEINKDGELLLVAQGGAGGCAATFDRPSKPEKRRLHLDLKLIADCGLVGFPNAGKSTLLKAVSRAKPLIADYPFTTLRPQLGIIGYEDTRQVSMADLPGLIEGAYKNVGLGHQFLKHVERTKVLMLLVDIDGFKLNLQSPHRNAFETIALLNRELELYDRQLLRKPAILCLNKVDLPDGRRKAAAIRDQIASDSAWHSLEPAMRPDERLNFEQILNISAKEQINTEEVKQVLRDTLDHFDDMQKGRLAFTERSVVL